MNDYIYVLKLRKDLLDENAWSKKEEQIVSKHFLRLKEDTKNGKVVLAGRTTNSDASQFGIVTFSDKSWDDALNYMKSDLAVKKGIMTATLFPYRVALIKKR